MSIKYLYYPERRCPLVRASEINTLNFIKADVAIQNDAGNILFVKAFPFALLIINEMKLLLTTIDVGNNTY